MYKLFLNVTKGDSELHGNRLFLFFFRKDYELR